MSRGGRIDNLLNRIPGYAGYRDKERRRDSDRVVRERLALEYGQLAERLGRLATSLAQDRQIAAMPLVDRPHKRLVSFIDRVRTASYGYSPLFSDNPIDAKALDQLAAFDRSLADQQDALAQDIAAMEAADPNSPEFKAISQRLTSTVEGLHDRFDYRHHILHSGEPVAHEDALALLEMSSAAGTAVAYRLHEGEAVEYDGVNYSVVGRVSADAGESSWRAFQLRGGTNDRWLLATPDASANLLWLRRSSATGKAGDQQISAEGNTYNLESLHSGTGEVIGPAGEASNQPVKFARYREAAGDGVLAIFDWGTGSLVLTGVEIDPGEVQLYSRER